MPRVGRRSGRRGPERHPRRPGYASGRLHVAAADPAPRRLTVTSGTRRYSKATGSLTLAYSTIVDLASGCPCTPNDAGVLTGTIKHVQAPLQHPSAPVVGDSHPLVEHPHL